VFEDFGQQKEDTASRGRRGASAALSLGIFAAAALGVGGAVTAHQIQKKKAQEELDVSFEALPKVQAPRPKLVAPPTPGQQKKAQVNKPVVAPKSIPTGTPPEAEGELAEAEDTGAVDGIVESGPVADTAPVVASPAPVVAEPPPPPPPAAPDQERETIEKPVFLSGCRAPEIPQGLSATAATIVIDVRLLIGPDGRVSRAKVVQGSPLVPEQAVLDCVNAQVFEPAHLPDGTPVPYPYKRRYTFRPSQA
jgi:Gram-negative bacterial TonB protein C-terminal